MGDSKSTINPSDFNGSVDGEPVGIYFLKNANGLEMSVTNFGARVVELFAPDRDGNFADVVLGHSTLEDYVNFKGERFLGATIGRFGNRIANGEFFLNGKAYKLAKNDGSNSLHGGVKGFDMRVWKVEKAEANSIDFSLFSPDGEEGFPGNLSVKMRYSLTDENEFVVEHRAECDADTVINLTHHSFFNLHGEGCGSVNDHILRINADKFTPIDERMIPTGKLEDVSGTPFDFRVPTEIGKRLGEDDEQLKFGNGYDHNWVLGNPGEVKLAAVVEEPKSGRVLSVYTSEPGMQFYGGNFFDGKVVGKGGRPYGRRESFALETQHFPDSPNRPEFPSSVLKKGDSYYHVCKYVFGSVRAS